jgi:hypothetical protein
MSQKGVWSATGSLGTARYGHTSSVTLPLYSRFGLAARWSWVAPMVRVLVRRDRSLRVRSYHYCVHNVHMLKCVNGG